MPSRSLRRLRKRQSIFDTARLGFVGFLLVAQTSIFRGDPRILPREIIRKFHCQVLFHLTRLLYFFRLMPKKIEVRSYFPTKRFRLINIGRRFLQFSLALGLFVLIELEAKRIFHHLASLAQRRIENSVCLTLRNNLVSGASDISASQEADRVFEPDLRTVQ